MSDSTVSSAGSRRGSVRESNSASKNPSSRASHRLSRDSDLSPSSGASSNSSKNPSSRASHSSSSVSTEGSDSDLSSSRQYYGLKGLERAAILAEVQREIDERRRKSPPTTPNRADKTHISPEDSQRASQRHFKIAATLSGAALLSTIALTALSLISGAWPIIITAVITLALASASKEASKKANTGVQIKTNANPYYISNGWHKSQATHLKKDIRNNLILLGLCIGGYIVGGLAAIGLIATGLMVPMLVVSAATTLLVGGNIIKSAIDLRAHNKVIDN